MFRTSQRVAYAALPRLRFARVPHPCPFPCSILARLSSSSSSERLLRDISYLRERALDVERRSTEALERLGELPPPRTPIAEAFRQAEGMREGIEWGEQPTSASDVRECVERIAQQMRELEQRLLQLRGTQLRQGTEGDDELQRLMEEAGRCRSDVSHLRRANEEVKVEDGVGDVADVRIGPIPRHLGQGPPEPVWIAIPLKGEDIEDVQPTSAEVIADSAILHPLSAADLS